jgi:hypothetical protein
MLINTVSYSLAIATAYASASGARLNNTGEFASRPPFNMRSTLVTLLMLCSIVTGLAAVFYFSWSFLHWQHVLAFLLTGVLFTGFVARTNSRTLVWATFIASEVVVLVSEGLLLTQ